MWILIAIALALGGLALAVALWGVDSRESSQIPEWARPEHAGSSLFPDSDERGMKG
jgi:hypothetical protein